MARLGLILAGCVSLLFSGLAQADISPTAEFIKTRPYSELNTDNPIGAIVAGDIDKASGIVASVGNGLVAWADGRGGEVVIMGRDLTDVAGSEFLISVPKNQWQEDNPFVGWNTAGAYRWVVYDTNNTGVAGGDPGNIEGAPPPTALATPALRQLSPVISNLPQQDRVSWIHDYGTASAFPEPDTDIYTVTVTNPIVSPLPGAVNITSNPAPRDSLAAGGNYLVWQEMRSVGTPPLATTSWDIAVYDFSNPGVSYIDAPTVGLNQVDPDVSGHLVVWTEIEDYETDGSVKTSNIYFQDLTAAVGPLAVTTTGSAAEAAISLVDLDGFDGDGVRVEFAIDGPTGSYFVVWQDHREDGSKSNFPTGNGEDDYNWDIWGQEIRYDGAASRWDLYKDPFFINDAKAAGRQTLPDIDGITVVWQSQAPNVEDIYVWGPVIPEPCTLFVLAGGTVVLLAKRRRLSGKKH